MDIPSSAPIMRWRMTAKTGSTQDWELRLCAANARAEAAEQEVIMLRNALRNTGNDADRQLARAEHAEGKLGRLQSKRDQAHTTLTEAEAVWSVKKYALEQTVAQWRNAAGEANTRAEAAEASRAVLGESAVNYLTELHRVEAERDRLQEALNGGRCKSCRHWRQLWPNANRCEKANTKDALFGCVPGLGVEFRTNRDYGCVKWEKANND